MFSIFTLEQYGSPYKMLVEVRGFGQEAVLSLKEHYPSWSKIVLHSFIVDGNYIKCNW